MKYGGTISVGIDDSGRYKTKGRTAIPAQCPVPHSVTCLSVVERTIMTFWSRVRENIICECGTPEEQSGALT